MRDEQSRQVRRKRQLELAQARDRDNDRNQRRKTMTIAALVIVMIAAGELLCEAATAQRREEEKRLRQAKYHEERARLLTAEIQRPENSPFATFLKSGSKDDRAWLVWTTLPYLSFMNLVALCEPFWLTTSIEVCKGDYEYGTPRPHDIKRRKLDCLSTIAMTLYFAGHPDCRVGVGNQFGMIDTHATKYIHFGSFLVIRVLQNHPDARIEWPCQDPNDPDYLKRQVERVFRYVPELHQDYGVKLCGWMDGVRFPIGKKKDYKKQRNDYSGEKKRHLRKIILISDADGYIVACVINCPGRWGDSKCTDLGGLYDLIERTLPDGYSIGADTAFRGALQNSKILKILKKGEYLPAGMSEDEYSDLEKLLIKSRQPGEWINNVLIQSFRRLRCGLGVFDDLNGDFMLMCVLLHNWRTRTCDRNQVKKFFDILEAEEKIEVENGGFSAAELMMQDDDEDDFDEFDEDDD